MGKSECLDRWKKGITVEINKKYMVIGAIVAIMAGIGYGIHLWRHKLPDHVFMTNGRIEAQTIDIATRSVARVVEIPVEEGALVKEGDVIAKLDLNPLVASMTGAEANVRSLQEKEKEAKAQIEKAQSVLDLAIKEFDRSAALVDKGVVSRSQHDLRTSQKGVAEASLAEAKKNLASVTESIDVGRGEVNRLKDLLKDTELKASKGGRILYKLAEPGEVLQTGGKVVTILDLSEVYMTVFVPMDVAGKLKLRDEALIVLDALPDTSIPAYISYISPEAQFTPRQVETKNERAKMTFRIKARIPEAILNKRLDVVKTGVPGVTYVRTKQDGEWPNFLKVRPDLEEDAKADKMAKVSQQEKPTQVSKQEKPIEAPLEGKK